MINITDAEKKALNRRNIFTNEQLRRLFPRKYVDYSKLTSLTAEMVNEDVAFKGKLIKTSTTFQNNQYITKATVVHEEKYVNLAWFHNCWIGKTLEGLIQKEVLIMGKVTYNTTYNNFNCVNAQISAFDPSKLCIQTKYTSIKGIKEDKLKKCINEVLEEKEIEYLPTEIVKENGLLPLSDAYNLLHHPYTMEDVYNAESRVLFDDLLYFGIRLEEENMFAPKGTLFQANRTKDTDAYIKSLPYTLTNAQSETIKKIQAKMKEARRVNALVQGDVGCGKTTVAFATMITMAENGYQTVLMTPTVALGSQHYEELKAIVEPMGYNICFYGGKLTIKERKIIKQRIKEGFYSFIVGTQGVLNCEFKNLALFVADEEHKYGVKQRDKLFLDGVHMITLSATPIPRTLASTIYGARKDIYTINELPSNRKPIQTYHFESEKLAIKGVGVELSKGHQAYVVCPLKDECENEKFKDLSDVKRVEKLYKEAFPNHKVAVVTGSTDKGELQETLKAFKNGDINILVATSVIEVGVSVPNASVIIIYNAERFGLAELHQLRGRVGRGSVQSMCVLLSEDTENMRIKKMIETTDGFEIASADLEQRGMGDILGTEQSGRNKYIELALKYPKQFARIKDVSRDMLEHYEYNTFINEYEERNGIADGN